jgi:hypothetical protein
MPGFLKAMARNPRLLFGQSNLFLLSHMRANTSLFGHVLGSHPEIEGYYEMHIGYYSWRSLWRQKLLYFADHEAKPRSHIMFDKLLHNYCVLAPQLLARPTSRVIMMLRAPGRSIQSIASLYRNKEPDHPHADPVNAAQYYVERLGELQRMAPQLAGSFYYLDAESLVDTPDQALAGLSRWLQLATPLSSEYQVFENTGKHQCGDSSEAIRSGKIVRSRNSYDEIQVPEQPLQQAERAYRQCRDEMLRLCANRGDQPG